MLAAGEYCDKSPENLLHSAADVPDASGEVQPHPLTHGKKTPKGTE